jgi:hypothetical protein
MSMTPTAARAGRAHAPVQAGVSAPSPVATLESAAKRCGRVALIIASVLVALGTALGGITVTGAKAAALAGIVLAGSIPFTAAGFLIALLVLTNAAPAIIDLIHPPLFFTCGFWMAVRCLHWALLGGFTVLMLAAAWITFVGKVQRA